MHRLLLTLLLGGCSPRLVTADEDEKEPSEDSAVSTDTADSADTADTPPSDRDGDGWPDEEDCQPDDAEAYPGGPEVCNKRDDDCNGEVDDISRGGEVSGFEDLDADGWGATEAPYRNYCWASQVSVASRRGDCDDADAAINPVAPEVCDGIDNNCDGDVDPGTTLYADADGDGHGDPSDFLTDCSHPARVQIGDDCDDNDAAVSPSALEACDGIDNDCDGVVDGGSWYLDGDGDGFGGTVTTGACEATMVSQGGDDDDGNASLFPGAAEVCNGVDDDGDGRVDEGWTCARCDEVPGGFDWYVPDDVPSIQDAIDAAVSGESICVREGTYREAIDFSGKDILLYGEAGAAGTIIDATGLGSPVVTMDNGETSAAELVGFTLTGGSGEPRWDLGVSVDYCSASPGPRSRLLDSGGGVYLDGASPTLSDLMIQDIALAGETETNYNDGIGSATVQHASLGGAVFANDSLATLERVDVRDVSAYYGGAGYFMGDSVVTWSESSFDTATAYRGGSVHVGSGSHATLTNIAATGCGAETGAFASAQSGGLELSNVTAYGGGASYAVVYGYYSDLLVRNSILANSEATLGISAYNYGETLDVSYSLTWTPAGVGLSLTQSGVPIDETTLLGMLKDAPAFQDLGASGLTADDDLRLSAASPGVNAGSPDAGYLDTDGTTNDMGAFGGPAGDWW